MKKNITLWAFAILLTLTAIVFQRKTGPTYPKKAEITISDKTYNLKLLRSQGGELDAEIMLQIPDDNVNAKIFYRHYPTNNEYIAVDFRRDNKEIKSLFSDNTTESVLLVDLPNQPPAGKLQYYIEIISDSESVFIEKEEPILIRYKGDVPAYILIPHIIFMFLAMLISNAAGIFALVGKFQFRKYAFITFGTLLLGGMILGPIVQLYAFNELWAGVPFGWDLTDNKTLIMFIGWSIALIANFKKKNRATVIIASIVLIIMYSIPHSMHGSELNRETGTIEQG